jgi:sulfate transport system substrate-binding protein
VAVVDANVDRKGTRAAAEAYLTYLYSDEGQQIIARHYYRPSDENVLKEFAATFPDIELFPITAVAKDWNAAQERFFAEGAIFDRIYQPSAQ